MIIRKKGNVIYFGLAFMLLFLTMAGIFISVSTSHEIYNRIQVATEEGAKVRAQAVDMNLKEASGIVELFHERPTLYDATASLDIDHNLYAETDGHVNPLKPDSSTYQETRKKADDATKESIISIAKQSLYSNTAGNDIIENFGKDNICIQVRPLPKTSSDGIFMDFQCTTALGHNVKANNVRVSPVDSSTNTKVILDPDGSPNSGDEYTTQVVNIAFVGVAYEYTHFLEGFLSQLGIPYKGTKKSWAVAYPQIDECFGEFC
jgi:hypothetical protein